MSDLNWLPRESGLKDHHLWSEDIFSTQAPGVIFEKKPIRDPQGNLVDGLYSAWVTLNNPDQYNSYTTEMVKAVIAGFHRASADSSVVACVFTAVGNKSFCTGGNVKEYAEYYSKRPNEYGIYMDLFNAMVDGILSCKKPTICRVNGMRVAGGQEIGMATDITISQRPGDLRSGRRQARLRPGWRQHRFPAVDAANGTGDVELCLLRDVERLQDVPPWPDLQVCAGHQGQRQVGPQPHRPYRFLCRRRRTGVRRVQERRRRQNRTRLSEKRPRSISNCSTRKSTRSSGPIPTCSPAA